MRRLNAKQKKLITTYHENHPEVVAWDDIMPLFRSYLKSVNDYETLWSDTERFLNDQNLGIAL